MIDKKREKTEENYQSILAYETRTARTIATQVLEKPELSVWMILIPIVFIPFMQRYQKYKESVNIFCSGYLYTKKIALDIAYKIFKNELPQEDVSTIITNIVQKKPDADPRVLSVYQKQIQEIKILWPHYLALLTTGKTKYEEMIVYHYQSETNYLSFIYKLSAAEKEVTQATSATFREGVAEVPEVMDRMEKLLLEFRLNETKKFFN